MKFAALLLVILAACVTPSSAATQQIPESAMAPLLAAICEPGKIKKKSCEKVRGYPEGQDCSIELSGDGGEGRFLDADAVFIIAVYSGCEPHANAWGGSLLFEKSGDKAIFHGFQPGTVFGNCLAMARSSGGDKLICMTSAMFQGFESDGIIEVVVARDAAGKAQITSQDLVSGWA